MAPAHCCMPSTRCPHLYHAFYVRPPPAGGRCAMPMCVRGAAWAQAPRRREWPGATAGRCGVFPVCRSLGWLAPGVKHGSLALLRQQAGLRSMHTVHCLCCSAECQAMSNQHSSQPAAAAAAHAAQLCMPNPSAGAAPRQPLAPPRHVCPVAGALCRAAAAGAGARAGDGAGPGQHG